MIRKGASGTFHDQALQGASHHAVIPNVNTIQDLGAIWPRLSSDEKKLFDAVARAFLAAVMPDFRYRQTTVTLDVCGFAFRAAGRQPIELGWRAAFPDWQPNAEKGDEVQWLPTLGDGEPVQLKDPSVERKETRAPVRYNEGTLIEAMQNAWRFVGDGALRARLKEANGIGTPATRAEIIGGLKKQHFLIAQGKNIVPTETGLSLFDVLQRADPALVDPGVTAQLECLLDEVAIGRQAMVDVIDAVCNVALRIIDNLKQGAVAGERALPGVAAGDGESGRAPTPAMKRFADSIARQLGVTPPRGYTKSSSICRAFLDQHAPKKTDRETAGETGLKPASPAQIRFAEKMAQEHGMVIPGNATLSSQALSAWIDAIDRTSRGKRRAKTSNKPTRSTAPAARTPTTRSRKRKTDGITASAGAARRTSSTDTPPEHSLWQQGGRVEAWRSLSRWGMVCPSGSGS